MKDNGINPHEKEKKKRKKKSFYYNTSLSLAGNGGRFTWVRQSSHKYNATHPSRCAVFSCVQTVVRLPVLGILNVYTAVDACDCTRGLYGHRKGVCTGWRNSLAQCQFCAWIFSRTFYQLSYLAPILTLH